MKKLPIALCLVSFFLAIWLNSAQAAQPKFLVTWRAQSYAPPEFKGKILPGAGSRITVSFELVNLGKVLNLAGQTIYWYLNDGFLEGTVGKQTITFNAPAYAPNIMNLRIQIPNYKGNFLMKEVVIPLVSPEVVIEAPYPGGSFSGSALKVMGVPYFFNVASPLSLSFSWDVNGKTPANAENPEELDVTLNSDAPSGSTIAIGLAIKDPNDEFSTAAANVNLIFNK